MKNVRPFPIGDTNAKCRGLHRSAKWNIKRPHHLHAYPCSFILFEAQWLWLLLLHQSFSLDTKCLLSTKTLFSLKRRRAKWNVPKGGLMEVTQAARRKQLDRKRTMHPSIYPRYPGLYVNRQSQWYMVQIWHVCALHTHQKLQFEQSACVIARLLL
ncbi:hypothetical protein GQ54DRAFT_126305 [Martensiomyces pterosporus]|nr:hypothetical protein GQ54DRAFT_126305 [Martensiomyces pterosporus]